MKNQSARRCQVLFCLALLAITSAEVAAMGKKPARKPTSNEMLAVSTALQAMMLNPRILRVKEWIAQEGGFAICGLYNGESELSGNDTFRPFVAVYSQNLRQTKTNHRAKIIATGLNASTLCFSAISGYKGWNPPRGPARQD